MLDNIFQAIEAKAQEEVLRIAKQKKEALLALEEDYQREFFNKKEGEKKKLKQEVERAVVEFKQQEELAVDFKIQQEKNKAIREVYNRAKEKLSLLSQSDFEKLVKKLLTSLLKEKGLEGFLLSGRRTAAVLKKANSRFEVKFEVKEELGGEGFIFVGSQVEIDLTFEQLLKELEEKNGPQINAILFS